ncbi:unnamed protein product, partial [Ectocarpus sp. 12 AP-2014]
MFLVKRKQGVRIIRTAASISGSPPFTKTLRWPMFARDDEQRQTIYRRRAEQAYGKCTSMHIATRNATITEIFPPTMSRDCSALCLLRRVIVVVFRSLRVGGTEKESAHQQQDRTPPPHNPLPIP